MMEDNKRSSEAIASQRKTFIKWVNHHLQEAERAAALLPAEAPTTASPRASPTFQLAKGPIASLQEDLNDGKILCALLCQLSRTARPPFNMERLQMRIHHIINVEHVLKWVKEVIKPMPLRNIGAEDIVDGNEKLILGLIWMLILKFQLATGAENTQEAAQSAKSGAESSSARQNLLAFLSTLLQRPITNFTSQWQDGENLLALFRTLAPSVEVGYLQGEPALMLTERVLDLAEHHLSIPKFIDAEDLVGQPDEKSVMTYLAGYMQYYHQQKELLEAEKEKAALEKEAREKERQEREDRERLEREEQAQRESERVQREEQERIEREKQEKERLEREERERLEKEEKERLEREERERKEKEEKERLEREERERKEREANTIHVTDQRSIRNLSELVQWLDELEMEINAVASAIPASSEDESALLLLETARLQPVHQHLKLIVDHIHARWSVDLSFTSTDVLTDDQQGPSDHAVSRRTVLTYVTTLRSEYDEVLATLHAALSALRQRQTVQKAQQAIAERVLQLAQELTAQKVAMEAALLQADITARLQHFGSRRDLTPAIQAVEADIAEFERVHATPYAPRCELRETQSELASFVADATAKSTSALHLSRAIQHLTDALDKIPSDDLASPQSDALWVHCEKAIVPVQSMDFGACLPIDAETLRAEATLQLDRYKTLGEARQAAIEAKDRETAMTSWQSSFAALQGRVEAFLNADVDQDAARDLASITQDAETLSAALKHLEDASAAQQEALEALTKQIASLQSLLAALCHREKEKDTLMAAYTHLERVVQQRVSSLASNTLQSSQFDMIMTARRASDEQDQSALTALDDERSAWQQSVTTLRASIVSSEWEGGKRAVEALYAQAFPSAEVQLAVGEVTWQTESLRCLHAMQERFTALERDLPSADLSLLQQRIADERANYATFVAESDAVVDHALLVALQTKVQWDPAAFLERLQAALDELIEQDRLAKEAALERERVAKEAALEKERLEKEAALEKEKREREAALEKERLEREAALEKERIEKEAALERERKEKEAALERERIQREKERLEKEAALERERLLKEKERVEREAAVERERVAKALELEKLRLAATDNTAAAIDQLLQQGHAWLASANSHTLLDQIQKVGSEVEQLLQRQATVLATFEATLSLSRRQRWQQQNDRHAELVQGWEALSEEIARAERLSQFSHLTETLSSELGKCRDALDAVVCSEKDLPLKWNAFADVYEGTRQRVPPLFAQMMSFAHLAGREDAPISLQFAALSDIWQALQNDTHTREQQVAKEVQQIEQAGDKYTPTRNARQRVRSVNHHSALKQTPPLSLSSGLVPASAARSRSNSTSRMSNSASNYRLSPTGGASHQHLLTLPISRSGSYAHLGMPLLVAQEPLPAGRLVPNPLPAYKSNQKDPLDVAIAAILAAHHAQIQCERVGVGKYCFGGDDTGATNGPKAVSCRLQEHGRVLVRVGGGYMTLQDYFASQGTAIQKPRWIMRRFGAASRSTSPSPDQPALQV